MSFAKFNYKCRHCGKVYDRGICISISMSEIGFVAKMITDINNGKILLYDHEINLFEIHLCEDGSLGMADFESAKIVEGL